MQVSASVAAGTYYCTQFNAFVSISVINSGSVGFLNLINSVIQSCIDMTVFAMMSVNLSTVTLVLVSISLLVRDIMPVLP